MRVKKDITAFFRSMMRNLEQPKVIPNFSIMGKKFIDLFWCQQKPIRGQLFIPAMLTPLPVILTPFARGEVI